MKKNLGNFIIGIAVLALVQTAPISATQVNDFGGETIFQMSENADTTVEDPYFTSYGSATDSSGAFSNKKMSWYFTRREDRHQPPQAQNDFDFRKLGAYYLGDIRQKEIYLTFDEGYENGYTEIILDVLKEKNVPAAFFATETYIKSNPELIKRMVDEGHIVGNHTVHHKSSPTLSDDEMIAEITQTADVFKEITGEDMPPYFRPPMGEYSARTLNLTKEAAYSTIFWSFAHKDWITNEQPGADVAYKRVMEDLHNGEILLLHAVSSSNTEAMPRIIDDIRAQGYTFKSLDQLPKQ